MRIFFLNKIPFALILGVLAACSPKEKKPARYGLEFNTKRKELGIMLLPEELTSYSTGDDYTRYNVKVEHNGYRYYKKYVEYDEQGNLLLDISRVETPVQWSAFDYGKKHQELIVSYYFKDQIFIEVFDTITIPKGFFARLTFPGKKVPGNNKLYDNNDSWVQLTFEQAKDSLEKWGMGEYLILEDH